MHRRGLMVAVLLGALLLPSCLFSIKGFSFSAPRVKRGEKVVARLTIAPTARTGEEAKARQFIMVFQQSGSDLLKVTKPLRFDIEGNFGGPRRLVKDPALESQVLAHGSESCGDYMGGFASGSLGSQWVALTTRKAVKTNDEIMKTAETRIGLRAPEDIEPGGALVHFYLGSWRDSDATEGPSPDDDYYCFTSVESSLGIGNARVEP